MDKADLDTELPNEQRSFIDLTAEKTGLSKKVIKSAIDRDSKSSKKVKDLRASGELNASQANEIIKLQGEDQEKLAEIAVSKSAKEIKDIVKSVSQYGIDGAIEKALNEPGLTTEYKSSANLTKRLNKLLGKILLEEVVCQHEDKEKILKSLTTLRSQIDQVINLNHDYKALDSALDNNIDTSMLNDENNENDDSIEI